MRGGRGCAGHAVARVDEAPGLPVPKDVAMAAPHRRAAVGAQGGRAAVDARAAFPRDEAPGRQGVRIADVRRRVSPHRHPAVHAGPLLAGGALPRGRVHGGHAVPVGAAHRRIRCGRGRGGAVAAVLVQFHESALDAPEDIDDGKVPRAELLRDDLQLPVEPPSGALPLGLGLRLRKPGHLAVHERPAPLPAMGARAHVRRAEAHAELRKVPPVAARRAAWDERVRGDPPTGAASAHFVPAGHASAEAGWLVAADGTQGGHRLFLFHRFFETLTMQKELKGPRTLQRNRHKRKASRV